MGQSGMIGTFGPIPQEFRIEAKLLQPNQGLVGGIPGISQPMQPGIITMPSGQANTPANAIAAFNQAQPMSTQQLSFNNDPFSRQQPQGLAQFGSMLNRFS